MTRKNELINHLDLVLRCMVVDMVKVMDLVIKLPKLVENILRKRLIIVVGFYRTKSWRVGSVKKKVGERAENEKTIKE